MHQPREKIWLTFPKTHHFHPCEAYLFSAQVPKRKGDEISMFVPHITHDNFGTLLLPILFLP